MLREWPLTGDSGGFDGSPRERPESLRVIRRLPVTWQCGALGGQASDKPRWRKPRAGMRTTVRRAGAMGICERRAIGCEVGVVTARWGRLPDEAVAGPGEATNELRSPSPQL